MDYPSAPTTTFQWWNSWLPPFEFAATFSHRFVPAVCHRCPQVVFESPTRKLHLENHTSSSVHLSWQNRILMSCRNGPTGTFPDTRSNFKTTKVCDASRQTELTLHSPNGNWRSQWVVQILGARILRWVWVPTSKNGIIYIITRNKWRWDREFFCV